jgi:hypothetical protein
MNIAFISIYQPVEVLKTGILGPTPLPSTVPGQGRAADPAAARWPLRGAPLAGQRRHHPQRGAAGETQWQ